MSTTSYGAVGADLPDILPAWVLDVVDLPTFWSDSVCGCCTEPRPAAATGEPVGWAVPGVTGLGPAVRVVPPVSPAVAALQVAVEAVCATVPAELDQAQALADTEALLQIGQQLRVHEVRRVADAQARDLPAWLGYRSSAAWLKAVRPDGDPTDARLGRALLDCPVLSDAVEERDVSLLAARKVIAALTRCRPHVDRPDGLIDGQPGGEVVPAVVRNVVDLVCQHLRGVAEDDPRLLELVAETEQIVIVGGSDVLQLEKAFTLLARWVPPSSLAHPLDELVMAVLPSELEERSQRGLDDAALTLTSNGDGTGWRVRGRLSPECGERLHTALTAEAARDPRNPQDTAEAAALRSLGLEPWDGVTGTGRPRSRAERLHDALDRLLERYLGANLAGTAGKVPVQISVMIRDTTVDGRPGALPAVADSGDLIPRSMVRRWWCDSSVTVFVRSAGGKVVRTVHAQRTLTGRERRALQIETGGTCAGHGCCRGRPNPLTVLRPHHVRRFSDDGVTSLEDTVAICDALHHDLHEGRKTVRLRDGRYLDERGWQPGPSLYEQPPF